MDTRRLYLTLIAGLVVCALVFLGAVQALGMMGVDGSLSLGLAAALVIVLGFLGWLATHGALTHWLTAPGLPRAERRRVRMGVLYYLLRLLLRVTTVGAGAVAATAGGKLVGLLDQLNPVSADAFVLAGASFWMCVLGVSLALGLGCEVATQGLRLLRMVADGVSGTREAGGRG